jgi:hypothetical protein
MTAGGSDAVADEVDTGCAAATGATNWESFCSIVGDALMASPPCP